MKKESETGEETGEEGFLSPQPAAGVQTCKLASGGSGGGGGGGAPAMLLARCSPSEAPLCGLAVVAAMLFRSLDPIRISLLVDTVCVCVCAFARWWGENAPAPSRRRRRLRRLKTAGQSQCLSHEGQWTHKATPVS